MRIVLFSGTSEGHELSDKLAEAKIEHDLFVASEYGAEVMKENDYAKVHIGRIDREEMIHKLDGTDIIIDATHPYATEVTENIRFAAKELKCDYLRVIRGSYGNDISTVRYYSDIEECARALSMTEGNILLTTGSKELGKFGNSFAASDMERVYVRVLPSIESLRLVSDAGIDQKHTIAMHGPFLYDMNRAIFRQYSISHLVTKESGNAGGYLEKIRAALDENITCHVIERPSCEEGLLVDEAFKIICEKSGKDYQYPQTVSMTLIGRGMGDFLSMTIGAKAAIDKADAIFGAKRLIADIGHQKKYEMYDPDEIIDVLKNEKGIRKAVVVFSGDVGFCSGAKRLRERLSVLPNIKTKSIPGISSISYLASLLGLSYDDACLFSLHGKNDPARVEQLICNIKYNRITFTLLSNASDLRHIAERLMQESISEVRFLIGKNMSYLDEQIFDLDLDKAGDFFEEGSLTAAIINNRAVGKPITKILRDSDFIREKVPMSKEVIRHISILELGLSKNDIVLDIGSGTGSVSIEIAMSDPSIKVISIEKESKAVELLKKNAQKHNVHNLTVIEGAAPEALNCLPAPDSVFIGGAGGRVGDILDILENCGRKVRVVVNAVTLETIFEMMEVTKRDTISDLSIKQVLVNDVEILGSHHMLKANNPVMIFAFTLNGEL